MPTAMFLQILNDFFDRDRRFKSRLIFMMPTLETERFYIFNNVSILKVKDNMYKTEWISIYLILSLTCE